jgi:DNA gyrase subunit A
MAIIETSIRKESRDRYLTYALSVVSGRALPDVRDGLKPVQRRILFAMFRFLGLRPDSNYRKSAAVVGEVLAKLHPHGDIACYEAMVRMAQDFSLRYPLVDGQGNFGSLDGDSAAAYRYTEAKLLPIALEVMGEIGEETVRFRDNFDVTLTEPEVLPSRLPNLLMNGASGIAVGMATSIPPHNLKEIVDALIKLSEDPEVSDSKLVAAIKGPDFPTGCQILNSREELKAIYQTGRGSIRMRGEWFVEEIGKGKRALVISSIPYALNKAQLVEKIANCILEKKVPQLVDVRDESTDKVRIVVDLATDADPEPAAAFLCKQTPLETTFPVNLTVLVPSTNGSLRPELLSLRAILREFLGFREEVVEKRLRFEKSQLEKRIHILEGLAIIFDVLDEVLALVRKSDGRSDAATKLQKKYKLSEMQAFAVVDMRIYQLSRTNINEVRKELNEKQLRVSEIDSILGNAEKISQMVRDELREVVKTYGDKRRCRFVHGEEAELEFNAQDYVVDEDVFAIVTQDGWIKRIKQSNEVSGTRIREGDTILCAHAVSTRDTILFITNLGFIYSLRASDFPSSSGFGSPVQKELKFSDGEKIIKSFFLPDGDIESQRPLQFNKNLGLVVVSKNGTGAALQLEALDSLKRSGKRVARLRDGDELAAACQLQQEIIIVSSKGQVVRLKKIDIPLRESASVGVSLMGIKSDDEVVGAVGVVKGIRIEIETPQGKRRELAPDSILRVKRGLRGTKMKGVVKVAKIVEQVL